MDPKPGFKADAPSRLRPPHLSICFLIRFFANGGDAMPANTMTPSFVGRLSLFLLDQIKGESDVLYPPLNELLRRLREDLGDKGELLGTWLHVELQKYTSPDKIIEVMDALSRMLQRKPRPPYQLKQNGKENLRHGIRGDSILGMYIRQCRVTFQEMSFEEVSHLASDVELYIQSGECNTLPSHFRFSTYHAVRKWDSARCLREGPLLEKMLNNSIARVDKEVEDALEVDAKLSALEGVVSEKPRQLLWKHANAVKEKDYLTGIDTLLRYFDYNHAGGCGAQNVVEADEVIAVGRALQSRFPNALLRMSASQAEYGHVKEALECLNETILLAQSRRDDTCMLHCLALLCRILLSSVPWAFDDVHTAPFGVTGDPNETLFLLKRCLSRATKMRLPHLVVFCRMALAKFRLKYGMAVNDFESGRGCTNDCGAIFSSSADVHLEVMRASADVMRLHAQVSLASAVVEHRNQTGNSGHRLQQNQFTDIFTTSLSVFGPSARDFRKPAAVAVSQAAGSAHLLRSAAWQVFGGFHSSSLHALMHLCCFGDSASFHERATALAQLATNIAATKGFDVAEKVFGYAERLFPGMSIAPLEVARKCLAVEHAIYHGDEDVLERTEELASLADPSCAMDLGLFVEAQSWAVKGQASMSLYEKAAESAGRIFELCSEAGLQAKAASMLLSIARIWEMAEEPHLAMSYILSCLQQCKTLHLDLLAAEAVVMLAKARVDLEPQNAKHAVHLIRSVLPLVLAQGGLALQSETQFTLAKCMLTTFADVAELLSKYRPPLELLQAAVFGYEKLEWWTKVRDVYRCMGVIFGSMGWKEAMSEASFRAKFIEETNGLPTDWDGLVPRVLIAREVIAREDADVPPKPKEANDNLVMDSRPMVRRAIQF